MCLQLSNREDTSVAARWEAWKQCEVVKWARSWGCKTHFSGDVFDEARAVWNDIQSSESCGTLEICWNKLSDQKKILFDWEAVFYPSFFSMCVVTVHCCDRVVAGWSSHSCKPLKLSTLFSFPVFLSPFFFLDMDS